MPPPPPAPAEVATEAPPPVPPTVDAPPPVATSKFPKTLVHADTNTSPATESAANACDLKSLIGKSLSDYSFARPKILL